MAWLSQFLLGRPAYEYPFAVNPGGMEITEAPVEAVNTVLNGDDKRGVLKASKPSIKLNSNYLPLAYRDQFSSLAGISDSFLSFRARTDFTRVLDYAVSTTTTAVTLPNTSAGRLSAAIVAAGFASVIGILGVYTSPNVNSPGTNYYSLGSSYADATGVLTLATALPAANTACYITYTYPGWLVRMKTFPHKAQAGYVDLFTYDVELTGV